MRVIDQERLCPVQDGDIWKVEGYGRFGPHLFGCGDLTDGDTLTRLLLLAPRPSLAYSDPPWNGGDAKRYRTLSKRDGPKGRAVEWEDLFRRVLTPAKDRGLLMYVEMSRASLADATTIARQMGAAIRDSWEVHYRPGVTESMMFAADFRAHPGILPPVATITDPVAETAPVQALAGHEPGVVLDVCCGNGWTALAAHRAGWTFVGHELTPRRLWTAMKRISPHHELVARVTPPEVAQPTRVG